MVEKSEQQAERIKQLEEKLRKGHRQTNRFERAKRVETRKKPGRPSGHPGACQQRPDHVDEEAFAPLSQCPDCGAGVNDVQDVEQFVVDLPPVRPHVTRIVTQRGFCPCCKSWVRSRHDAQVSKATGAAKVSLGPRALGLAADLKHRKGMAYRSIAELFACYFGLRLTHGALVHSSLRLARRAEPAYAALVYVARQSAVVHTDDTGWRIDGRSAWLWVFATADVTVYVMSDGRGLSVVLDVLGQEFAGRLVSDGLPALDGLNKFGFQRAQCLGHLVRRAREMAEASRPEELLTFPRAIKGLLQSAITLSSRHQELAPSTFATYRRRIERRCDAMLAPAQLDSDNQRLAEHLRKHRDQLFGSLYDPAVPPTNNLAEQQLRGAVITRKIGGCNRVDRHAHAHAVLASLAQTAHRNGKTLSFFLGPALKPRAGPSIFENCLPFLHLNRDN